MRRDAVAAASMLAVLLACGPDEVSPLTVSEVTILAPLPGQSTSVAYFTLGNSSATTILLREVSSPDFAAVEMHATILDDGIAEMFPLDAIAVSEGSEIVFAVGASHLMLMEPRQRPEPGDVVTLEFHYESAAEDDSGLLSVTAPVLARGSE